MAAPTVLPTELPSGWAPVEQTTGVRLSGLAAGVYPGRREIAYTPHQKRIAQDLMLAFGMGDAGSAADTWRGHSFLRMTEDLITARKEPLPDLDHVLLAFQTPDLHVGEAVGCYLTELCPGHPQSLGVSEQGAGAPFTALKVADALVRGGVLNRGLLFVLDQTTPLQEPGTAPDIHRDAAVMIDLGGEGDAELVEYSHERTDRPALTLTEVRDRHRGVPVVVGTALAGCLPLKDLLSVSVAPADYAVTSVWFALAAMWPLKGPVLLADYDRYAGGLYTARLNPVVRS
ncbi:hypothetical protein [Actinophytocola oryzae]|uniref:Uncharacterized protein n=1 Tax=Actinophytocola oryzae TaxID=502181 RepID=A0A4R7VXG6_9PSEU|nr:hypothetical protein [Actinophytocola oryzae]TDV54820.1 hypothetical protein CLV71_10360 [Actinophytocola oryzae]